MTSPNGETDMNDIDIVEGRRELMAVVNGSTPYARTDWYEWTTNNAAAMFDAIETGRQWETIARRAEQSKAALVDKVKRLEDRVTVLYRENVALNAAFRDVADRTPGETLRERAVREVDTEHGYTMEFSSSPEAHAAEYDERERGLADRTPTPHHDGGAG